MKIYRMNENAELPTYATEGSAAFDIKSCFKRGDKLRAYNNWNKEVFITVKGVGQNPNSFFSHLCMTQRQIITTLYSVVI